MNDDLPTIRRVLRGDTDAFRLLVERYQGPLLSMIGNLVQNVNDRDDLAQEAFLAAYQNLASYQDSAGKFSTWLFTIARNHCFNAMRKRRVVTMESIPPQVDRSGPADRLLEAEAFAEFDRALALLPPEQKTAFVLAEIEGLSHDEICRIENAPMGTVKSRISRAKEKLRCALRRAPE